MDTRLSEKSQRTGFHRRAYALILKIRQKGEKMPTIKIKDVPELKVVKLVDLSDDSINKIAEAVVQKITEPVRHGHWVHKYDSWSCSECYYTFHGHPLWKYCPHCGAKNEVEE